MAKIAKPKKLKTEETKPALPEQRTCKLLQDVYSYIRQNRKRVLYGRAGEEVKVISAAHGGILLVELPHTYKVSDSKRQEAGEESQALGYHKANVPSSFPVAREFTNYDNPDAEFIISAAPRYVDEPVASQRPSYGAPKAGKRKK